MKGSKLREGKREEGCFKKGEIKTDGKGEGGGDEGFAIKGGSFEMEG